jgi:phosphoglycolate phosphatase-like HAD superfamily hydrolase
MARNETIMSRSVIALDGDGVLLDFSTAYAKAWERAFASHPVEGDASAYWPIDRWGVERLAGERLERFRGCFDDVFWSTVPAIDGALDACQALHDSGHTLVCVSALEPQFESARLRNLRRLGFPIERVVATSTGTTTPSPKASALKALMPVAFVDDYLPYLCGLPESIHTALVLRQTTGSPNVGPDLASVRSKHPDLADFARWWLAKS